MKKEQQAEQQYVKIVLPSKAATASVHDISQTLQFSGNIDAVKRVAIAPTTPGRIQQILVNEGDNVKAGQLLVRMDDYQLQQSIANLGQLKSDYDRIKTLYEKGSATAQQYGQIKAGYEAALAGTELLRSSVELRAPYSGTIIGKYLNDGEIYNGTPSSDGFAAVVALAQLQLMKIEVMVPEQDFVFIKQGQTARITVDAFPDTVFEGKVSTVNPALNRTSRTSRVTIEIKNSSLMLKPGMFARVQIVSRVYKNVLAVPSTAVINRDGEKVVFTVERQPVPFETTPKMVTVTTGAVTDDYTEITSGLPEGSLVLTENNVSIVEKTIINVTSIISDNKE